MNLEDFMREIEESWQTCPPNTMDEQFVEKLGLNHSLKVAFVLGAGIGLLLCKAKGTEEISREEVRNFMLQESIEMLFEPVDQQSDRPDRHV